MRIIVISTNRFQVFVENTEKGKIDNMMKGKNKRWRRQDYIIIR